ncbi:MAG: 50S ribosomal protein L29 [Mariprofundales bacterium]|nr:50S ribosomal protein L29 [Mariprofundales bacterium]
MSMKALNAKDSSALVEQLDELAAENMKLRFQKATMQLNNTARVGQVRREIAQIKTVLTGRQRAESKES